jgi:hypothetical protein
MKKIAFFITHKTLDYEHARATLYSLSKQTTDNVFDKLYLYNTHEDDISNETILDLCKEFNITRLFKEISIFDYDPDTHKSLGADINTIAQYCMEKYDSNDRVLLLKSDCVLSKNYFSDMHKCKEGTVYFVAPFVMTKARITDDEIFEYIDRDTFVRSDEKTFFVEDQTNSSNNDFNNRPGVNVTDESIHFASCTVNTDFSCHYLSVELMKYLTVHLQSWGGVKFYNLVPYFVGTDRSFVVHKFHDIRSVNRSTDREGPVTEWLYS